jgi:uncharacterized protein
MSAPSRTLRLKLYSEADAATAAVAAATGLTCPTGCARCCESPHIHASIAEMMPVAEAVLEAGQAEALWERAAAAEGEPCILLERHGPGLGGCSVYALRPIVCRLFGYAAVRGRGGLPELSVCAIHAAEQPEIATRARNLVTAGLEAPLFMEMQERSGELDPDAATLHPINRALRLAIERVALRTRYGSGERPPGA